jgi:hypothetical protein
LNRPTRLVVPLVAVLALAAGCDKKLICSSDLALCDSGCTSLATDPANCGACGHACAAGYQCQGGQCDCPADRAVCGGACVNLTVDPANCGTCGNACTGGWVCTPTGSGTSACAVSCAGGLHGCGGACVDLATNRDYCGACGRACGTNEHCAAGRCVADLYVACFNTDEVREATLGLAAAGVPHPVGKGPMGLAWTGTSLGVISAATGGAETLALMSFDPPAVRATAVWTSSAANPDLEYVAEHGGLVYVSHNSSGKLLVLTPAGTVVDEVTLTAGAANPQPQGIAFDTAERAYVALQAEGDVLVLDVSGVSSCAAGTRTPPCTSVVARVDLSALASPTASPMPSRIAIANGHAFVTLWNLDATWSVPAGSHGRLAAIRTADATLDAAFAGSTNGLVDLGPDCLDPADVAVSGGKLFVTCGAFAWPSIVGSGIVPVDVSGASATVLPIVAGGSDQAPGKLAFCGSTGYVGDRNSGRVWVFDPTSAATSLGAGVALCPPGAGGYAFVSDLACGR